MTDKQFTKLLQQAERAAVKHSQMNAKVRDEVERRHGVEYGELDIDPLIDCLDYGLGRWFDLTAESIDKMMRESRHHPDYKQPKD